MNASTQSQHVLRTAAERIEGSRLVEGQNALEFVVERVGLIISITVPRAVQEWYVDVEDPSARLKASDWYDYAGYEASAGADLDREMAKDLESFIAKLIDRPLRMRNVDVRKARAVLEWHVDDAWVGAVPADTRERAARTTPGI